MFKKKLFDEDSEEEIAIKTENEYAKKYDTWREKEEIHKLEQKYGPDALNADGSEPSDSEDESDEPPEVSEEVETQFLKTLALLKTKDPRIYDPNFKCFDQEEEKKSEEKSKPKSLTFEDSDDEDDGGDIFKIEKKAEIDNNETSKEKSIIKDKDKKEKKIKEYLTGKAEHIDEEVEKDLAPLKALWSDPKLNEGEAFLRDYILNKRYLEEGEEGVADRLRDDEALEADAAIVEEQSHFERAYNFRFEEPDDEFLKRYPRTVNSTRPRDDRRARKRAEVRARKEEEKKRKMDEIARLKALKLKEIQEKIAKIKEVTGNDQLAFKEEDIEGDFDPEEHDRRMRALFDDQYYGHADDTKPTFPDLDEELEIENWDNYEVGAERGGQEDDGPHCEDENFNMDADYDPSRGRAALLEEIQKTLGTKRRNRKRKSKLASLLAAEKPVYTPQAEVSYDAYMEEYFGLDCEDVIAGDLRTRFKYREVVPNDYGLSVEEILLADDRELTQWVPLKKLLKLKPEPAQRGELAAYRARAAHPRLKRSLLPSLCRALPQEPELAVPVEEGSKKKKKKKKNKERSNEDAEIALEDAPQNDGDLQTNGVETEAKQKKKKKKDSIFEDNEKGESDLVTNETFSSTKGKKKKKNKYEKEHNSEIDESNIETEKKKKKYNNTETNADDSTADHSNLNDLNEASTVDNRISKKKKKHKDVELNSDSLVTQEDYNNSNDIKTNKKNRDKKMNTSLNNSVNSSQVTEFALSSLSFNKKQHSNEFIVEEVSNQGPSQEISLTNSNKKIAKANASHVNSLKRKHAHTDTPQINKRTKQDFANSKVKKDFSKFKQKDKSKYKNKIKNKQISGTSTDNPLNQLSDERLKAYGLNPKKYKNFLKYKKF